MKRNIWLLPVLICSFLLLSFSSEEEIKVIGGGHTWSGGFQYLPKKLIGEVSKDFNVADKLWKFFESHIEE